MGVEIGFALAGGILTLVFYELVRMRKYVHVDDVEWCDCDGGSKDE